MRQVKELTIEFSMTNGIIENYGNNGPDIHSKYANAISIEVKRILKDQGLKIIPIPYDGLSNCMLAGGRAISSNFGELLENINIYNQKGISVMVAANGGLLLDDERDFDIKSKEFNTERILCELLAKNNTELRVSNAITITLAKMERSIKNNYPEITTIASCIRFLWLGSEAYNYAFKNSDIIVPPIIDENFFEQYQEYIKKMLIFLNLECINSNPNNCIQHYMRAEAEAKGVSGDLFSSPEELLNSLESGQYEYIDKSKHSLLLKAAPRDQIDGTNHPHCYTTPLIDRPNLLVKSIRMGVNKFKMPRKYLSIHHPLETTEIERLINLMGQYG